MTSEVERRVETSQATQAFNRLRGMVLRSESGYYQVLGEDGRVVTARLAKKARTGARTATTSAVIGDRVALRVTGDEAVIEAVENRQNALTRLAPGRRSLRDVLAANLDAMVIIHSLAEPAFNPARVDRLIALAEQAEIPPILVVNKADLVDSSEIEAVVDPYQKIGIPTVICSAVAGRGIEELRSVVTRRLTALVGPSGAGKSSLLNRLQPGLALHTGEISEATGKGRHTTVASELLLLDGGGYVADTPGLRSLALVDAAPEEIEWFFREFRPYLGTCRFADCMHEEVTGCAIYTAMARGDISPRRYASYRHLLDEARESASGAMR